MTQKIDSGTARPTRPVTEHPVSVQVGPMVYPIEWIDKLTTEMSGPLYGKTMHFPCRGIKIRSDCDLEDVRETLLHEIIHTVEEWMDVDFKEHEVRQLSLGLFQVLTENPKVTRFILGHLA